MQAAARASRPEGGRCAAPAAPAPSARRAPADGLVRLYGLHTVRAALDNPAAKIRRMLVTRNALERLGIADPAGLPFPVEIVEPREIDRITGRTPSIRACWSRLEPLRPKRLDALGRQPLVVVLDQVTDPHNVGAIMRSAVAFGAGALITTERHSPANRACSQNPPPARWNISTMIEVKNLAEALEELHAPGSRRRPRFGRAGRTGSSLPASASLSCSAPRARAAPEDAETVSALARLDMPGAIRSLNVSNAAAVALYAARV
jgi:23S rRNA (guanosine2251-2'-O)-methyltransferase